MTLRSFLKSENRNILFGHVLKLHSDATTISVKCAWEGSNNLQIYSSIDLQIKIG